MYKSKCCLADVKTEMCPDFIGDNPKTMKIGTAYFTCKKCGQPCDVKEGFISIKEMQKKLKSKRTLLWYLESWWYRYFWNYLDMLPRRIYWFFQRGYRGWSDYDTWNFDIYLAKVISQGLRYHKKYQHGIPPEIYKKYELNKKLTSEQKDKLATKEYNNILDIIIVGFESYLKMCDYTNLKKKSYIINKLKFHRAMDLFKENFHNFND
jgi:hypothetical protein